MSLNLQSKRLQDTQALMDSVMANVDDTTSGVMLDSVAEMGEKMYSFDKDKGVSSIRRAIFDGVKSYEQAHGHKPGADLLDSALNHAKIIMDDATESATSLAHNSRALVPMQAVIAIRAMLTGGVPFAHYLNADKVTGEAPFIILSHLAGAGTGKYAKGDLLNGVGGGEPYIMSDRTHKLSSANQTVFTGKITPVVTGVNQCDQAATAHPLYPARTQILVNGLRVATTQRGSDSESTSGIATVGGKGYPFTAQVKIKTGEVTVTFQEALPENTAVLARGFLNLEEVGLETPSIIVDAQKYLLHAMNYRANVTVTPEAEVQFTKEIGIDPAFEGTMAIRQQHSLETLYETLRKLSVIGQYANGSVFDFAWKTQGVEKTQSQIALELIGQIGKVSQVMANQNGSHGVSHIYVGETMRSVFLSMGRDYFEPSGLPARPGAYRLGRLAGLYDVYYTPKGITPAESKTTAQGVIADRMLLIGANAANPAFNPVILGEASAPRIEPIAKTASSANSGYWVTGKNFIEQNPVNVFASSVATIDVINTAY